MPDLLSDPALQGVLAILEIERAKIAKAQTKGYAFIVVGVVVGIVGATMVIPVPAIIVGAISAITGGVFLYRIGDALSSYKSAFKLEVIGHALKFLDQSLSINPNAGIGETEFIDTQLFTNSPDRYSTEDLVSGKADKTSFYFAEVNAEYKTETTTKNGTQTNWHNIFKGILFTADFNKNFNGVTVVRPKDFGNALGAWFSKNLFSIGSKNLVQLENINFEKTFVTHAIDQVEARYILTPAMMERILALNHQSKDTVSLSFINTKMYIAFPLDRNCFEAPIFKTLLNPNLLNEDVATIKFMYDVVREMDLNTRIWNKS
ncbi:hypothetical protein ABIB40_001882 [Pedobacter sp. UYP30]|uniref:DUF3137 domain-containing protein n=1 Tax=Pedobacter sp. UYP30 TaxID=1756400 RepID=UPI0033949C9F